jgi:hypothetical protein
VGGVNVAGLVPAIHALHALLAEPKTWMPGTGV